MSVPARLSQAAGQGSGRVQSHRLELGFGLGGHGLRETGRSVPDWLDRTPEQQPPEGTHDYEAEDRARAAAALTSNREVLLPRAAAIASGDDERALLWAWQQDPDAHSPERRVDFGRLQQLVGADLVDAFKAGWKRLWRRQDVPMPQPGEDAIPVSALAGLTGLTLEIRDGLDLRSLSEAEADMAARYALYELNALPVWFGDLLAAHPAGARRTIREALRASWESTTEDHGAIRLAVFELPPTRALMRALVIELLAEGAPRNKATSGHSARLLVTSSDHAARAVHSVSRIVKQAETDDARTPWLRAWAHFDPLGAAAATGCCTPPRRGVDLGRRLRSTSQDRTHRGASRSRSVA